MNMIYTILYSYTEMRQSKAHKYGEKLLQHEFGSEYGQKDQWEGLVATEDIVRRKQRHDLGIGQIIQTVDL